MPNAEPMDGEIEAAGGAPQHAKTADEGWHGLIYDIAPRDPHGIFSVGWDLVRAPIETMLRLAADIRYRGYWKFLIACLGLFPVLVNIVLPWIGSKALDLQITTNGEHLFLSRLKLEVLQIAGILILTPAQYYLCRALSPVERTPRAYFKLCVLSVSYGTILRMLVAVVAFGVGLGTILSGRYVDAYAFGLAENVIGSVIILAFVTVAHRRFWLMGWLRAGLVTLVIAAVSWTAIYPMLFWMVGEVEKIGRLGGLAG